MIDLALQTRQFNISVMDTDTALERLGGSKSFSDLPDFAIGIRIDGIFRIMFFVKLTFLLENAPKGHISVEYAMREIDLIDRQIRRELKVLFSHEDGESLKEQLHADIHRTVMNYIANAGKRSWIGLEGTHIQTKREMKAEALFPGNVKYLLRVGANTPWEQAVRGKLDMSGKSYRFFVWNKKYDIRLFMSDKDIERETMRNLEECFPFFKEGEGGILEHVMWLHNIPEERALMYKRLVSSRMFEGIFYN